MHFFQEEREESYPHLTISSATKKYLSGRTVSAATFQREFELEDVLDYVKTGIGSIIEDEVTQRFDSEELKVMEQLILDTDAGKQLPQISNQLWRWKNI